MGNDRKVRWIRAVEFEGQTAVPFESRLADNYPNPFNPSTVIEYSIARDSHVNISIYDVSGRLVRTLVDEFKVGGDYRIAWDGKDSHGAPVSTGVYFYRLIAGEDRLAKKMVMLR